MWYFLLRYFKSLLLESLGSIFSSRCQPKNFSFIRVVRLSVFSFLFRQWKPSKPFSRSCVLFQFVLLVDFDSLKNLNSWITHPCLNWQFSTCRGIFIQRKYHCLCPIHRNLGNVHKFRKISFQKTLNYAQNNNRTSPMNVSSHNLLLVKKFLVFSSYVDDQSRWKSPIKQ